MLVRSFKNVDCIAIGNHLASTIKLTARMVIEHIRYDQRVTRAWAPNSTNDIECLLQLLESKDKLKLFLFAVTGSYGVPVKGTYMDANGNRTGLVIRRDVQLPIDTLPQFIGSALIGSVWLRGAAK